MAKLTLFFCITLVVMMLVSLIACSTPAPASVPASQPAPVPVKPIELKFSTFTPETAGVGPAMKAWAQRIGEQSGGRLTIKAFYASSLLSTAETLRGLQTGQADIAYYNIGTNPGAIPLMELTRIPFIGLPSVKGGAQILRQVTKEFPELQKEIEKLGLKYMAIMTYPSEQFFFTKKIVRLPSELKGMKIIGRGNWPQVLEGTGVACLNLNIEDWYTGLERGLVEGHITGFLNLVTYKTMELLKYHTMLGEAGGSMTSGTLTMNLNVFNGLPPDLQKVLLDNCQWFEPEQMKAVMGQEQTGLDMAKAANHTITYLKPEEIQQWYALAKPLHEKYMTDNAAAGPIRAIYDRIQQLIKQYKE